MNLAALAGVLCLLGGALNASEFYVAPNGTARGTGAKDSPWDLATALAHPKAVRPGDTIWLLGGTYTGSFTSTLEGAAGAPIVVRQAPGERAVIDGRPLKGETIFTIRGAWTWYWGFELTSSVAARNTTAPGSSAPNGMGFGFDIFGPNTKVINTLVHDTAQGFGFWVPATDAELYGNIIYNNGWIAPDRGHGHGIYAQNNAGTKLITDNMIFNQLGTGFHIYGTDRTQLNNFRLRGNVHFNDQVIIGGGPPLENLELLENMFYRDPLTLYYNNRLNGKLILKNNYIGALSQIFWFNSIEASANTFYRNVGGAALELRYREGGGPDKYAFDGNTYVENRTPTPIIVADPSRSYNEVFTLDAWRKRFGFDMNGRTRLPAQPDVIVRRNLYEPERSHIVIYNWPKRDTVEVDVSATGVRRGDRYQLRNVQNYFADVITGTYNGGPLRVAMTGHTAVALPVGIPVATTASTFPEFGAFVFTYTSETAKVQAASAASFRTGAAAPDSIVSAFGQNLAPALIPAAGLPLPVELGGAAVTITDAEQVERPAQLFAVAPTQINLLVPAECASGPAVITVRSGGQVTAVGTFTIQPVVSGLFSAANDGKGPAAGQAIQITGDTQTFSLLSDCTAGCKPAPVTVAAPPDKTVLVLYGTGIRGRKETPANVTIGGIAGEVLYAGPQGDSPGLDQVNVAVPPSLSGAGVSEVIVSVGESASNPVVVALQ